MSSLRLDAYTILGFGVMAVTQGACGASADGDADTKVVEDTLAPAGASWYPRAVARSSSRRRTAPCSPRTR